MKINIIVSTLIGLILGVVLTFVLVKNGEAYTKYQIECEQAEEYYYQELRYAMELIMNIDYLYSTGNVELAMAEHNYKDRLKKIEEEYQTNKKWFSIKIKPKSGNKHYYKQYCKTMEHYETNKRMK